MRLSLISTSLRLAVALAAASLALPLAAASAAGIGGFSVRPGTVDPANPATRAYFIHTAAAGSSFTEQAVVSVPGSQAADLRVYAVDGLTGVTSGAVYSNRQDRVRRAGAWVTPAVSSVHVGAHQQRSISFTVHVPRAARPGDHLAGLAFEGAHPHKSAGKFSVTEVIRAVVGIEIEVPGPARQQVSLTGVSLRALPGTQIPSVVVSLGDAGGKLCKPRLAVSLAGGGRQLAVARQLDTILPGDYIPFPLPWPRPLAAGAYSASARALGCGRPATLKTVVRLGGKLTGTTADPSPRTATAPSKGGSIPWWVLGLVAVGGVLAGILLARRGRPGRSGPPAGP